MKPGDRCPCGKGNLYEIDDSLLVRIVGQAPFHADVYRLEKLRCNTCGDVFTAKAPEGIGSEKYDATSTAMVALMKYGSGFPFHRLERLEANLGIPLPASTQWEMVRDGAQLIQTAFEELIRQAASGEVVYNDDTSVKILEFLDHNVSSKIRNCLAGPASSRPASFPHKRAAKSRCSFPAANTPEKISPMCWPSEPRNYPPRFKCAMPCRGIFQEN